ncbi:MAG: TonB-dependent receptor [Pseudomonadota bacterium]
MKCPKFAAAATSLAAALSAVPDAVASEEGPGAQAIEQVVVTARRREESLQDVPVAITALSGGDVDRYATADLSSISQMVPSLVVGRAATGSSANLYLRGVGSTSLSSGFDQSVSINVDGVSMSRGREIINSMYDLRKVEVMKGPQALFFGKNSTAGVIAVESADPTREFEASFKTGYEIEADETYSEGVISGPLTEKLRARLAVRYSKMDGYFTNDAEPATALGFSRDPLSEEQPEEESLAGRITAIYEHSDTLDFELKVAASRIEDSGQLSRIDRGCAAGRDSSLSTFGVADPNAGCEIDGHLSLAKMPAELAGPTPYARDGDPYTDYESHNASLTANWSVGAVDLTSVTGHYGFRQPDMNAFNGATSSIYVTQFAEYDQFSQELRAVTTFDGPLNATAGLYYASSENTFNTAVLLAPLPVDPATGRYDSFNRDGGFDGESTSAFVELQWDILADLELAGGARWSREEKDSYIENVYTHPFVRSAFPPGVRFEDEFRDDNVSPQATLTWYAAENVMLYAAYKEGFKAGGFNTSMVILPTSTASDARFDSEEASGVELGARTTLFDRRLTLNATAYDFDYDELQNQIFDPVTLGQAVANVGTLRTRGLELESLWRVPGIDGLNLRADVAYNDAEYSDYVGTCYAGQTIAEGCNLVPGPNGAFTSQDFDGRTPPRAPEWSGRAGGTYSFPVSDGTWIEVTADLSYSDEYYFNDGLRPDMVQDSFSRLDASVRLMNDYEGWELALIGRNLTDELVVTSGNDVAAQDGVGGTGTASGVRADYTAVLERPRQVMLQFRKDF